MHPLRRLFLAVALLSVGAAHAQPATPQRPLTTIDAAGLAATLQRAGFTAEARTENGETLVFARRDASSFQATLSQCANGRCGEIELFAAFDGKRIAWERINGWNARTRFARAFLDEKRTPSLQLDVSLEGGVTPAGLEATLKTWGASVDTFALFLAAPGTPAARPIAPADPAPLVLTPPPASAPRK